MNSREMDPRLLIEVANPDEALVDGQRLLHGSEYADLAVAGLDQVSYGDEAASGGTLSTTTQLRSVF
jgi:hypothetical protein